MWVTSLVPSWCNDGPDVLKFGTKTGWSEFETSGWPQVYDHCIYSAIVKYDTPTCPFRRRKFHSRKRKGISSLEHLCYSPIAGSPVATGCDT